MELVHSKSNYKRINVKYKCTFAETDFFVTGKKYDAYVHEITGNKVHYIKAEDGIMDLVGMTTSKFKKVGND